MAINTVIATNVMSLNANLYLGRSRKSLSTYSNRLSSGSKITTASEDSASLTISEKMKAQIRGLEVAEKNSEDAISLVKVFDSCYGEVQDMIQRCREITVQAANDTNTDDDRCKLYTEIKELSEGIYQLIDQTEFNGIKLESLELLNLQIGSESSQSLGINGVKEFSFENYYSALSEEDSAFIQETIDEAMEGLLGLVIDGLTSGENASNGGIGFTIIFDSPSNSSSERVYVTMASLDSKIDVLEDAVTTIEDAFSSDPNFSQTVKNLITSFTDTFRTAVSTAINTTISNWNEKYNTILQYNAGKDASNIRSTTLQFKDTNSETNPYNDGYFTSGMKGEISLSGLDNRLKNSLTNDDVNYIDPDSYSTLSTTLENSAKDLFDALDYLTGKGFDTIISDYLDGDINYNYNMTDILFNIFDSALSDISNVRSYLGSMENRIKYNINYTQTYQENMYSANSYLEDTDMAQEMMNYTKTSIIVNAATALLSQANSLSLIHI